MKGKRGERHQKTLFCRIFWEMGRFFIRVKNSWKMVSCQRNYSASKNPNDKETSSKYVLITFYWKTIKEYSKKDYFENVCASLPIQYVFGPFYLYQLPIYLKQSRLPPFNFRFSCSTQNTAAAHSLSLNLCKMLYVSVWIFLRSCKRFLNGYICLGKQILFLQLGVCVK